MHNERFYFCICKIIQTINKLSGFSFLEESALVGFVISFSGENSVRKFKKILLVYLSLRSTDCFLAEKNSSALKFMGS